MIYIIGHKSPDTDSIASAIAYAWFLGGQGIEAKAARTGEINPETKFVLEKFGFEAPELLEDATDKKIVLVDHNEKEHQPEGDFEILEIWDHHRFNFSCSDSIVIRCEPVGSTATLLAKEFFEKGIKIPKEIAGLLISAILSDTVIFKSTTTTETDREIIEKLNQETGFALEELGKEIKMAGMDLDLPVRQLILRDFKEYNFGGKKIGVGQIELIKIQKFLAEKREEILEKMQEIKQKGKYDSLMLIITDILKQGSEFFIVGEEEKISQAFNVKLQNNSVWIKDLMSRKKQIIPLLEKALKS